MVTTPPEQPPMSDADAVAEAHRRWGSAARVLFDETTCATFCCVGIQEGSAAHPDWIGIGRTWELAFAEADLRAARVAPTAG